MRRFLDSFNLWHGCLVLLGVIVIVLGAVVTVQQAAWRDTAQAQAARYTPPPYTRAATPPVALFVGDSYSAGTGADPKATKRWTALVAAHEGWLEANIAFGGTGYLVSTGSRNGTSTATSCGLAYCPNYSAAVDQAKSKFATPSIVVVSGGRNDVAQGSSLPAAESAVGAFYDKLVKQYPKARIYVTSPIWDASSAPGGLGRLASRVKSDARRIHATYLDIGEPLHGYPDDVISDGIHPNNAGHAAIAAAVEKALGK